MIKILIGGSPCTFWSIAQKGNREVEAEGMGWELFKNYLIARDKFRPDLFLYENNKSAAQPIKDQISHELGVDLMHINSALVSAQNRQRFYAFNWNVEQPEDRGIVLRDILETPAYDGDDERRPVGVGFRNRREADGKLYRRFETDGDQKANALTTVQTDSMVAEPICVNSKSGRAGIPGLQPSLSDRIYSVDGKAAAVTASYIPKIAIPTADSETSDLYEVKNGQVEIKGRKFPINLPDGFYIIRKPTPVECERLQTLPDGYTAAVSPTQRRKGLGNGWTAEVIIHILNGALKDVPRDEEIVVLSMYDGIGTGRYCLDKMGFTNVTYYAYEIDEHAMKVAMSNYPDIIQLGDAFNLRRDDWELGKRYDDTPPTAKDPAGGQEEQEEHHEHIHSESGADTATKTPTAGADTVWLDGEVLQRSEDPEGVRDLAEGKEEPPGEGGDISAEETGAPADVLAQFVKETLDEFLKRSIIKKLTMALKNAGVEPEPELLERLNSSTLKEVGAVAVAFPGYITAAILARDIKEGTEK